jgi:hypothetical protein
VKTFIITMVWEMDENDTLSTDEVETIFNNHVEFSEASRIYENFPSVSTLYVAGVCESEDGTDDTNAQSDTIDFDPYQNPIEKPYEGPNPRMGIGDYSH